MAIRCGVTLMPASRHWATSRSMPAPWAAPVGGDEDRRAGGAERRKRLTGEIFSAETILSRGRQNKWSPYGALHKNGRNNGRPRKYEPKIKRTDLRAEYRGKTPRHCAGPLLYCGPVTKFTSQGRNATSLALILAGA